MATKTFRVESENWAYFINLETEYYEKTRDMAIEAMTRALEAYMDGKDKDFEVLGTNSKMFVTNADIISYRLTQLDKWTEQRNEIAQIYIDELGEDFVVPKMPEGGNVNNWHKFVIRFGTKNERKRVKDVIKQTLGINLSVHYEKLLYANNLYGNYEYRNDQTPNAEIAVNTVLSLPIHPWLEEEEIDKLCTTLLMA